MLKFVQPQDPEYSLLCSLRYRVFFQAQQLPFETLFDDYETSSLHLAVVPASQQVVACGRLTLLESRTARISQMAVDPLWRQQGYGAMILEALIERAAAEQVQTLTLQARLSAVPFYQKFGFVPIGKTFASAKTGIPHQPMQYSL